VSSGAGTVSSSSWKGKRSARESNSIPSSRVAGGV
jgi:hypothetical protein